MRRKAENMPTLSPQLLLISEAGQGDLGWGTKSIGHKENTYIGLRTCKNIRARMGVQGKFCFQAVLDRGPQVMPVGLGFSPAFSSYTVFTLLSTGASGSSRLKPSCPGNPVELNASFLVPELTLMPSPALWAGHRGPLINQN